MFVIDSFSRWTKMSIKALIFRAWRIWSLMREDQSGGAAAAGPPARERPRVLHGNLSQQVNTLGIINTSQGTSPPPQFWERLSEGPSKIRAQQWAAAADSVPFNLLQDFWWIWRVFLRVQIIINKIIMLLLSCFGLKWPSSPASPTLEFYLTWFLIHPNTCLIKAPL